MATYVQQGVTPEMLKGTKTEQNLHTSLSGESQAYLRYLWFEKKAEADGFTEVADIFRETAENEKAHAEIWFRYLGGSSSTEKNLDAAAGGEHFEWSTMYADFEPTARSEGFDAIADLFARVASIEKTHEERYRKYLQKVQGGEMFHSENTSTKWICLNCGYVVTGKEPPKICPVCSYPQGYFKESE